MPMPDDIRKSYKTQKLFSLKVYPRHIHTMRFDQCDARHVFKLL
jgi:hypothetical protein